MSGKVVVEAVASGRNRRERSALERRDHRPLGETRNTRVVVWTGSNVAARKFAHERGCF